MNGFIHLGKFFFCVIIIKMRRQGYRRSRKSTTRSRKRYVRKYGKRMSLYTPRQRMYTVTRTWWSFNWTPSVAAVTSFWQFLTMTASQIPAWGDYSDVFDEYRIQNFKIILRPRYDNYAGNDTTDTTLPGVTNQGSTLVHAIIDPKSSILAPSGTYSTTTLNNFLESGIVKTYTGNKAIHINVKYPCVANDTNGSANAMFVRAPWFSTNQPGAVHRGVHVFLQDINMTGTFGQSFDVFYQATVSFKGMR